MFQKAILLILCAVRTWNLTKPIMFLSNVPDGIRRASATLVLGIKPLQPNECLNKEQQKADYILLGNRYTIFTALKVPRQCSLVLLVKAGWREDKAFGSAESRQKKSGAWKQIWGEFRCGRLDPRTQTLALAFDELLFFTMGGATLRRNFYVNIGRATWEACSLKWNLGSNSAFVLGPSKTKGKEIDRDGRLQDPPDEYWLLASSLHFYARDLMVLPIVLLLYLKLFTGWLAFNLHTYALDEERLQLGSLLIQFTKHRHLSVS
jgi:hypothetical protein